MLKFENFSATQILRRINSFQPKSERDLNEVEAASEATPQSIPPPPQQQQLQSQQPLDTFPATSVLRIRRRRSPLHQFAESLLERTRQATTPATVSLGVPGTNYVPTVTAVSSGSFPLHFERIPEVSSSSVPPHHPQVIFNSSIQESDCLWVILKIISFCHFICFDFLSQGCQHCQLIDFCSISG